MKKYLLLIAMVAATMTVSAQEKGFWGNKFFDNWYVGLNAGVGTKTTEQTFLSNLNPNAGVRVGKWLTPAVGIAAEGNFYFDNKFRGTSATTGSTVRIMKLNLLGTLNLMNTFGGYPGWPRNFEIIALGGIGMGHQYGDANIPEAMGTRLNTLDSKFGLDFALNLGQKKAWQIYLEPSITYSIAGVNDNAELQGGRKQVKFDIHRSNIQINLGVNYKFNTSNKTHNFLNVIACDQNEIDALNATINDLRNENAALKNKIAALQAEIENLKKALADAEKNKNYDITLPSVFYKLNKSVITPEQAQNVALAAQVMKNHPEVKIQIKGYASPEGPHDNNLSLGVRRANAVRDMLINQYGISADRITAEGCGETDKLFEVFEFNRVAMLYVEK